jgi:hypothetical protein
MEKKKNLSFIGFYSLTQNLCVKIHEVQPIVNCLTDFPGVDAIVDLDIVQIHVSYARGFYLYNSIPGFCYFCKCWKNVN